MCIFKKALQFYAKKLCQAVVGIVNGLEKHFCLFFSFPNFVKMGNLVFFILKQCRRLIFCLLAFEHIRNTYEKSYLFILFRFLINCKNHHFLLCLHILNDHQHPSGPNHQHSTFSRRTTIPTVNTNT